MFAVLIEEKLDEEEDLITYVLGIFSTIERASSALEEERKERVPSSFSYAIIKCELNHRV